MATLLKLRTHRLGLVRQPPAAQDPVATYLARYSTKSSQGTMRHSLVVVARALSEGTIEDPHALAWASVNYADTLRVRRELAGRYKPATASKHLQALRGIMRECWRHRLLDHESFQRIVDFPPIRGHRIPPGRQLTHEEIRKLFEACWSRPTPANVRMAAMLAVFLSTGCRRAELSGIQLDDYDAESGRLLLRGKGNKERLAYIATPAGKRYLARWLAHRGDEPGPFFRAMTRYGHVYPRPLSYWLVSVHLERLAARAGVQKFNTHDFRRTFVSDRLEDSDIETVMRLVGHADPKTTSRYSRRGEDTKIAASAKVRLPEQEE